MKNSKRKGYAAFQVKIMRRFLLSAFVSVSIVIAVYLFFWKQRFGDWLVSILEFSMKMDHESAFLAYHNYFRENRELFFIAAIIIIFVFLLWLLFRWMTRYFDEINRGIDELLTDETDRINLSPEMIPFEDKLNDVKDTLSRQKEETRLAEQRKDELVMYLAHDIRTPLTSVIGYLNLLEENTGLTVEERAEYVNIALDKAYRLEQMVDEFFEITRYNSQQVKVIKRQIDLYYMLVQLCDELSPIFALNDNSVSLNFDEDFVVYADPDKLARVFSNILKNAASYSYAGTKIEIYAEKIDKYIKILFKNRGNTIPQEKLSLLFDKFYRLDKARISDVGGTGLGLAIAKEIVILHGGSIEAQSEEENIIFTVKLPLSD